ncbi:MAG: hypothetical protein FWG64_06080 [Firmicutes bacterium]|nr:hypothetical protein [Bacillota bacterium]
MLLFSVPEISEMGQLIWFIVLYNVRASFPAYGAPTKFVTRYLTSSFLLTVLKNLPF